MRRPGDVVFVSCYEPGHQPQAVASAAAYLRRAGFHATCLDLAVEPFDDGARARLAAARLVVISVPMHTALVLGRRVAAHVRRGTAWTTDAPYRETADQLRVWADRGILAVEMQAASLFAFAHARSANVAMVALVAGIAPCLPGFAAAAGLVEVPTVWLRLYDYAWFVSFGAALVVYYALTKLTTREDAPA